MGKGVNSGLKGVNMSAQYNITASRINIVVKSSIYGREVCGFSSKDTANAQPVYS